MFVPQRYEADGVATTRAAVSYLELLHELCNLNDFHFGPGDFL